MREDQDSRCSAGAEAEAIGDTALAGLPERHCTLQEEKVSRKGDRHQRNENKHCGTPPLRPWLLSFFVPFHDRQRPAAMKDPRTVTPAPPPPFDARSPEPSSSKLCERSLAMKPKKEETPNPPDSPPDSGP